MQFQVLLWLNILPESINALHLITLHKKARLVYCKDLYWICNVPVTKNKSYYGFPMFIASNETCLWWHLIFSVLLPFVAYSAHFFSSRSIMKLFCLSLSETEVLLFPEKNGVWGAKILRVFSSVFTIQIWILRYHFLLLSVFFSLSCSPCCVILVLPQ